MSNSSNRTAPLNPGPRLLVRWVSPTGDTVKSGPASDLADIESCYYCTEEGAVLCAFVSTYTSVGEDNEGVILRLRVDDDGDGSCDYMPVATQNSRGLDLHIAGEGEALAFVTAMRQALQKLEAKLRKNPRAARSIEHAYESLSDDTPPDEDTWTLER